MTADHHPACIVVDFEIDAETVFLLIKNSGAFPALNLQIKPSAPIPGLQGKKDITTLSIFKKIQYLAPLKEIRIFVDSHESFFRHLKEMKITFSISYEDQNGTPYHAKILHDLEMYTDLIFFIKRH